jgi:glycosyltransferase involved in cell wall biosynthesis
MKYESSPELSVVCPFYNEEMIIEDTVRTLLERMRELDTSWELIIVNDGSTDGSKEIAVRIVDEDRSLKLLSYSVNRGRGYALRRGIDQAQGKIIITTEIDLSWGEDIVSRLYKQMKDHPEIDILIASPHLPGGGYKNVPRKRVLFSHYGNVIIRALMSNATTMNTGMTRAYRREVIKSLPLDQDRKEFHLEVIMKAQAFNYNFSEIPCVLEWKEYKHEDERVKRKSSSKVNQLVLSHTLFSLFANPIRYVWGLGAVIVLVSFFFFVWSIIRLVLGLVSVFTITISLSLAIIALLFFAFGIIAQQGYMVQREIWTLKRDLKSFERGLIKERTDLKNQGENQNDNQYELEEERATVG